jgi:sugar phosphate isomerase/epimerase
MRSTFSRREFLTRTGSALLACGYLSVAEPLRLRANPLGMPIGVQAWDVRFILAKDWDQGWAEVRKIGFQSIDWLSFGAVVRQKTSLGDLPAKRVRQALGAHGISCENCQFTYPELHGHLEETMAYSHELGLKNIIAPPSPGRTTTVDDWKWQGEQLNILGEKIIRAGFHPVGYHNHDFEFWPIHGSGGVKPYDVLMESTDPKLVRFQIDVGNLTFGGGDAYLYLTKYLPRYFSLHAKDYRPGKSVVPDGQGILDWKRIFTIVSKGRIENYYVETDPSYGKGVKPGTPWPKNEAQLLRESYLYLHNLKI